MSPRRRSRTLVLAPLLVIAAATAAEAGARAVDLARGRPFDAERSRDAFAALAAASDPRGATPVELARASTGSTADSDRVLHPYVAWELPSTQEFLAEQSAYYAGPDAPAALDVLLLGGTSARQIATELEAPLREALADLSPAEGPPGRLHPVRLHVGAQPDYKQPQPSLLLAYLLALGHAPDLVIEIGGREEARSGWSNAASGTHPLYPPLEPWSTASNGLRSDWELVARLHDLSVARGRLRGLCERVLATGIYRSAVLEHLVSLRAIALRSAVDEASARLAALLAVRPRDAEIEGPGFAPAPAAVAATIAKGWEEASASMHAMCARRGIGFLQVLEPPGEGPAVLEVYPELRSAGARLVARRVLCLDLSAPGGTVDLRAVAAAARQALVRAGGG